jgi:sugar phosphate isomerase/epimerase
MTAKEIGFNGVELAVRDPRTIDQDFILSTILDAHMEIPAIGTGQAWGEEGLSFTDPDPDIRTLAVQRVCLHLNFAKKAGAMVIIGLLRGKLKPGVDSASAWEWMYAAFCRCCQEAEKQGVNIAFEPINRYETTLLNNVADGLLFMDRVGSSNLGMLLDTFHMNIEEASIEDSIHFAGNRIFHFHYADSNRWYPGAGHLNFPSIVKALSSAHYSGYLSGEHRPDPDPLTAVQKGFLHMQNAISSQE